jgi:hypothetical protein
MSQPSVQVEHERGWRILLRKREDAAREGTRTEIRQTSLLSREGKWLLTADHCSSLATYYQNR